MAEKTKKDGAMVPVETEPTRSPAPWQARRPEHRLGRLRDEMDSLFDHFFDRWLAPMEWDREPRTIWDVDVEEEDKEVVVRAEAPGFEPEDFNLHVTGNTLTIQAEKKHEAEEKRGEVRYRERSYGRFQRAIPLPAAVHADKAQARYHSGILEIHLPRTEEAQRKRIEVKP